MKQKTKDLERQRFARRLKLLLQGRAGFPLRIPGFPDPTWNGPPSFIQDVHADYFLKNYQVVLRQPMFDQLEKLYRNLPILGRPSFLHGSGMGFSRPIPVEEPLIPNSAWAQHYADKLLKGA